MNGFFAELLGLLKARRRRPGGVVVRGLRCDARELAKLFPEEAAALVRATSRDDDDESVPEVLHGRCGEGLAHERLPAYVYNQERPRAARLMVERARGAPGDAEVYSCASRAAVVVRLPNGMPQHGDHAVVAPEAVDPSLFSPAARRSTTRALTTSRRCSEPKRRSRALYFQVGAPQGPGRVGGSVFGAFQDESAELVIHAYRPSWERGDKDLRASRRECGPLEMKRA